MNSPDLQCKPGLLWGLYVVWHVVMQLCSWLIFNCLVAILLACFRSFLSLLSGILQHLLLSPEWWTALSSAPGWWWQLPLWGLRRILRLPSAVPLLPDIVIVPAQLVDFLFCIGIFLLDEIAEFVLQILRNQVTLLHPFLHRLNPHGLDELV